MYGMKEPFRRKMSWRAAEFPQVFKMWCQGGWEETDVEGEETCIYWVLENPKSICYFATWERQE